MDREQQLKKIIKQLVFITAKNRHWKKQWDEHHGTYNRERLSLFEKRIDHLLENLPIEEILKTNPELINTEEINILKEVFGR